MPQNEAHSSIIKAGWEEGFSIVKDVKDAKKTGSRGTA
jgi:hypothetical protein